MHHLKERSLRSRQIGTELPLQQATSFFDVICFEHGVFPKLWYLQKPRCLEFLVRNLNQ